MSSIVFAEQSEEQGQTVSESKTVLKSKIKNRSGYETDDIGTGGRSSVTKQLYLDDIFLPEHLRFPEFDKSLQPYYEWKRGIRQKRNLQLGTDYTSLFQKASESLSSHKSAAGGVYRLYGRWLALNKNEKNSGALVFKLEHSHNYGTSISPDELGAEVGYLGSTGTLYSDFELVLNDFNWAQHFNDGQAEFIFGRLDLNDYMDVVDYANPWTTFQNSNILENHSIAIPDTSFGFNLSNWLNHHWYLKAAISDANGSLDDIAVFEHGAEFFSYAELGWAPSSTERQLKGLHITIWHVDERVSENIPDGEGIAIGGSWSFDKEWIVFGRFGQSTGEASLMRRSTTIGVSHIWKAYFDVFGFAVNYSELVDESLRDQTTMETFLKIQLANNIAVTPSFQLLINPALNLQEDYIQIVGLRLRITL
jgi:porin